MKRRAFLTATAGAAAAAAGASWKGLGAAPQAAPRTTFEDGSLGGLPLVKLRDRYRMEFDEFLDFFDRHVVDREHGGFTCSVNHDGTPINTNKTAWFEGRGIWCYSFMFNHGLAREDKYLDCARRSVDFIMKHRPAGGGYWPAAYSREGGGHRPERRPARRLLHRRGAGRVRAGDRRQEV